MTTNQRLKSYFHSSLTDKWDKNDGVDFAIALSRITGWLLQVDWFALDENDTEENMIPLRVSVGTDQNDIFDFNGKSNLDRYYEKVLQPIVAERVKSKYGGILNRFYSEEKLNTLPLRFRPNKIEIEKAKETILRCTAFLSLIPTRLNPEIPAHIAAQYSHGYCVVFAQVKKDLLGLPAIAISVNRYSTQFMYSNLGFCHSVNTHPDGDMEDSWGKQPLSNILNRFGILEYTLSEEEHVRVNENLKKNTPERYKTSYKQISQLLSDKSSV